MIFAIIGFLLLMIYFPKIKEEDKRNIFLYPKEVFQLKLMVMTLSEYTEKNNFYVMALYIYSYILMQTFAIPGPLLLSIISGSLWGISKGFLITSFCATFGSACCYTLSSLLLKKIVVRRWPKKVFTFTNSVRGQKDNLFYYFLFLRVTPIFPNISVNLISPIAGISYKIFVLGTFVGLIPFNIIHVSTGATLNSVTSIGLKPFHFLILALLGIFSLFPIFVMKITNGNGKLNLDKVGENNNSIFN